MRNITTESKMFMQKMYVDIHREETKWFELECCAAGVAYSIRVIDRDTVRYTFDESFACDVSRILSLQPVEPVHPSLADRINNIEKKQQSAHKQTVKNLQAGQQSFVVPPTDRESRWVAEKMKQELEECDKRWPNEPPSSKPATRKPRASLGRINQIKARLTDTELVQFRRRVKKSGLSQGDYIRAAVLTGKIVIEEHSVADVALLDELALIRAELGRQGGLLKMIIRPNEGQRELSPSEWDELISTVRSLEAAKNKLSRLEGAMLHGNHHASYES